MKYKKKMMMQNYKKLASVITSVNICVLVGIPLGKNCLDDPYIPYGYSREGDIFYFIVLYIVEFACIFIAKVNYKYLVENNLTKHTKAKQLYVCLSPILTFIAIIFLGIFVK